MADKEKKSKELPEQKMLNKYLEWGVALAGTVTGAFTQSLPTSKLIGASIPTLFGAIVIAVLLLLFVSTRKRKVLYFNPAITIVLLLLAGTVFEYNRRVLPEITVPYPPDKPWQSVVLKGTSMTEAAREYQRSTQPRPTESDILWHFNSHVDDVWTPESRARYQTELDVLYLLGVALIGLTVIAAFDTLQGKKRKRRTTKKRNSQDSKIKTATV